MAEKNPIMEPFLDFLQLFDEEQFATDFEIFWSLAKPLRRKGKTKKSFEI